MNRAIFINLSLISLLGVLLIAGLFVTWQYLSGTSVILADDECAPPCWRGIVPGQTSESAALTELWTAGDIDKHSITENRANGHKTYVSAEFGGNNTELAVWIYSHDRIVVAIMFDVQGSTTLSKVISKTGDPQWTYSVSGCGDARWFKAGLLNRNRGVYIEYFDPWLQQSERPEIAPESPVSRITYFDSNSTTTRHRLTTRLH